MRILQVHNRYREVGGEDSVARNEAVGLRLAGHEVIEHHIENPPGRAGTAEALALSPWNPRSERAMRDAVARHQPDVAHVHNTWYALSPSVLAALSDAEVPVVMTLHNYRLLCVNALLLRDGKPCEDCIGRQPWRGVVHRCYRGSAIASTAAALTIAVNRKHRTWSERVDRFIAPSAFVRGKAVTGGLPQEKIIVKPHGVDDPGPRLNPPSGSRTVLYVGRLSHEKGTDVLLDAWARGAPPGLELVVVGDGPLRAGLEARGLPSVRFAGWCPATEVRRLMLSSRALAFPSICYESFAIAVVEALAAGLPVLAPEKGALAELVGGLGRSWLVPEPTQPSWTGALGVLSDDNTVDAAGLAARASYTQRLTMTSSIAALVDIYASLVGTAPSTVPLPLGA